MRTIEDYSYIINPPDCKEGDEWFDGRWKPCRVAIEDTPEYIKRRRRIDVGEGFELVGLDEVPGWVEYTIDGQHWADNGWYNCNVREIIKRRPEILAIRRRKKVEPFLRKERDALESEVKRLRAGIVELFNKLWLPIPPLPVESHEEKETLAFINWINTNQDKETSERFPKYCFLAGIHYERHRNKEGKV